MNGLGFPIIALGLCLYQVLSCGDSREAHYSIEHVRHIRRAQPGSLTPVSAPTRALEWGQLNFLHTTDTHGWLEGHLKELNYGADWGDFVSFAETLKRQAEDRNVDLLIVDTGDLHDGTGLSDATDINGEISMKIFQRLNYDLLTIGNHEIILAEVAYETFHVIAKFWGDRYLTSNIKILDPNTNEFIYVGKRYRYFTTQHGLRVMAFGVIFDLKRKTDVVQIITTREMVAQDWFQEAIRFPEPIDIFLVLGHNPVRSSIGGTFGTVHKAIRRANPATPIQIFGGHTHIRDFVVLDENTTGLESGRYCETLGWLSMSGFNQSNRSWTGASKNPANVPNPKRKATINSTSPFRYSRRYLDWNQATFEFHSGTNQISENGLSTTALIATDRDQLQLNKVIGCIPEDFCITCAPFNSPQSIFSLLSLALAAEVVNHTRSHIPRYIIANTGGPRYDLYKGSFTYDDTFTIMPSRNAILYIPGIACSQAAAILGELNGNTAPPLQHKQYTSYQTDLCVDISIADSHAQNKRDMNLGRAFNITRREVVDFTPGYSTVDDFGSDGDDTVHSPIPYYDIPQYYQGTAGFDGDVCAGSADIVFVDFAMHHILNILGPAYTENDVSHYISANFTMHDVLPEYVKHSEVFQANMPDCQPL